MRLPSKPDALESSENKPEEASASPLTVNRDPSYPDRARIDSDVRAFLRPVSSPWIVFDRDSRVDDFAKSALRIGAVFASSPSFIDGPPKSDRKPLVSETAATPEIVTKLDPIREGVVLSSGMSSKSHPAIGMFPSSTTATEPCSEPSNLVVASDVMADSSSYIPSSLDGEDGDAHAAADPSTIQPGVFARKGPRRLMAIMGACVGVLALASLTTVALSRSHVKTAAATTQTIQAAQATQPAAQEKVEQAPPAAAPVVALVEPATIELDAQLAAPAPPPTSATTADQHAGAVEPNTKMPLDPKKRFGKLTIKDEAKHKNVWFDGKRMLGAGQRSFMVFCGMHTVAVNSKTETKDIEIPCNGEYAVTK